MSLNRNGIPVVMLGALMLAEVVPTVETSMLNPALPILIRTYGDPTLAYWVFTMFYVVAASSVALSSRLGDIYGRGRILLGVLVISLTGSLISACSTSIEGLLLGRGLYAAASAASPLAFGLIREHFPLQKVPFGIAVAASMTMISGALGVMGGGLLLEHFPWRTIFKVSSGISIIAIVAVWFLVPHDRRRGPETTIDWLGGILTIPAIAGLLSTIFLGKTWGWTSPQVLLVLAGSCGLLAWWAVHELRQHNPLIDVRLLTRRQIALTNLGIAAFAVGVLQSGTVMSVFLQQPEATGVGFGASPTLTGMLFVPLSLMGVLGGPLSGWTATRYGARRAALFGAILSGGAWGLIAFHHSDLVLFMALFYVEALGLNMLFCAIPNLIVEAAPHDRTSEATGVTLVVRQIATGTGTQIVGFALGWTVLGGTTIGGHHFASDLTFTVLFGFFAVMAFLTALLIGAISSGRHGLENAARLVRVGSPGGA